MNENIDLCEILKDCPEGTSLYSPLFGEACFKHVENRKVQPIIVSQGDCVFYFDSKGRYLTDFEDGECLLFPSKDVRTWEGWKCPNPKFDPKTLKAFDRVLARIGDGDAYCWFADFVSVPALEGDTIVCVIGDRDASMIIPYNDDTKHLVGTSDEAHEYYRYWEDLT